MDYIITKRNKTKNMNTIIRCLELFSKYRKLKMSFNLAFGYFESQNVYGITVFLFVCNVF